MFNLSFIFVTLIAVCVIETICFVNGEKGTGILFSVVALVFYCVIVFLAAPQELGYSRVFPTAEEFTRRLDNGVAYQHITSSKDGVNYVLLVKETCTSNYRAIRVKTDVLSEYFTLIGGVPTTVATPVCTVPEKK